ncbi:nuclease-related domain-containing protein [Streptomyces sp. NPDC058001]|uniref:nuclease-related domain-containing protein n=1 Tax=Streptomyces sp. NPDC058001 TaxID=3346300 RepID=UPI0036EB2ACB
MDHLEVKAWKRYGHDRLYVSVAGGPNVAWFDRASGRLEILEASYRDQVLDVLAPHLAAPVTGPAPHPVSHPVPPPSTAPRSPVEAPLLPASSNDLAANRPGDSLLGQLEGAPTWWARQLMRLLRQEDDTDSWRKGLVGERIVGAKLDRLKSRGWFPLHSITLPSGADIDHLLIGPGGVFCLNTKYFRNARVWVGDAAVKVNGGQGRPYVRNSRHEGSRASKVLTKACGFTVNVTPVLVFVSATTVNVAASLHDVRVIRDRDVPSFRRRTGVLERTEIESIHTVARNPRTWLGS